MDQKNPIIKMARNKYWQGCGNPHTLLVGMQIGAVTMENSMESPTKLQMELLYNLVIPLLGSYPKNTKTLIQKDTCTPMVIAALFTITKIWKQPKCPSTDEWIKKMWNIYNGILLSH